MLPAISAFEPALSHPSWLSIIPKNMRHVSEFPFSSVTLISILTEGLSSQSNTIPAVCSTGSQYWALPARYSASVANWPSPLK